MTLTIKIEMDNEAFDGGSKARRREVWRIIREALRFAKFPPCNLHSTAAGASADSDLPVGPRYGPPELTAPARSKGR